MNDTNSAYSAPIPSRKMRFHQRRSAEERRSWVKRHERSGQTLKQFCEQHGLALSSFCLWKRQFAQDVPARRGVRRGALIEVPLSESTTLFGAGMQRHAIAIQFPDGTRIDVGASTDVRWLAELMRALRERERAD